MQDDAELLVFMTPFSPPPPPAVVQSPPEAKVADDLDFHMDDMLHVKDPADKTYSTQKVRFQKSVFF
jgi:hypothetical protein